MSGEECEANAFAMELLMPEEKDYTGLTRKQLIDMIFELNDKLAALPQHGWQDMRQLAAPLREAVGFFASAVRCGERWSPRCDEVFGNAMLALKELEALPPAPAKEG